MKRILLAFKVIISLFIFVNIGYSQTFTFTSAGVTGNVGPTQTECNAAYNGTSLDGDVSVTNGIQFWVVPVTGNYSIEAFGGQGYGAFGGRGAHIKGDFNLTAGTTLKILVGQKAGDYLNFPATTYNHQFGGGGGSFVTQTDNTPIVIAGGGGGSHATSFIPSCDGQITESGAAGVNGNILGAGGTMGQGGIQASSADAGGGLLTNGDGIAGGISYLNGGLGGFDEGFGGFGCGGGTSSWNNYRGGGGGGYSGGGGANNGSSCCPSAGGGGSFNSGINPVNLAGVQIGDGQVVVTRLCDPTPGTLTLDSTTLSDVIVQCSLDSLVSSTATDDCNVSYNGVPDVTLPISNLDTITINWTYSNGVDTLSQTQTVYIIDSNSPVPDSNTLAILTAECSIDTLSIPTALDQCTGAINGTHNMSLPITADTVIVWTYEDGNGNSITQVQNVVINDTTAPVADSASLPLYVACNSASPATPTATDNCEGVIQGVPDVTLPITTSGITTIIWTYDDGNGNVSNQTQDVEVLINDSDVTVSQATITADQNGASYQWINCDDNSVISGETNQSFTADSTGEYAVVVSNSGCVDTSQCILIDFTNISESINFPVKIYPNPVKNDVFTIEFEGNIKGIEIVDDLGRVVYTPNKLTSGIVNVSGIQAGRYLVRLTTSKNQKITKILIIQ